jgi:hypothetical protein
MPLDFEFINYVQLPEKIVNKLLLLKLAVVGKSIMQIDNRWIDAHRITI